MYKIIAILMACAVFAGCKNEKAAQSAVNEAAEKVKVAVFIPGVISGSPTYELLTKGIMQAAKEADNVTVTIVEAGYNQAEWGSKLSAVAASGIYDLIVSSNPSMPEIAASVAEKFPNARFAVLDGDLAGNPAIYTLDYDKHDQAYSLGYLAALLTAEMGGKGTVGLLAAQHYPIMDNKIYPFYLAGAKNANPDAKVDFRIVGNWSDAGKALEVANDMIDGGVKVILAIAGSGNEGVVQAASERGAKVLWFDSNAYAYKPGVIAGCCVTLQDKAAAIKLKQFLDGTLPFGFAETVGFREGYVDFIDTDPLYLSTVSKDVQEKMAVMLRKFRLWLYVPGS